MIIKTVSNTLIILISGLINLAPKNHRFNRKAPATPSSQDRAEAEQDGHPNKVKTKGAAGKSDVIG